MKKTLFYTYGFVAWFVLPVLIGGGVADLLLSVYDNFSRHWVAGAAVCLFTGAVASWFPMQFLILFLIEDFPFVDRSQLRVAAFICWAGGTVAPLILGFRSLAKILSVLLCFTAVITVLILIKALRDTSRWYDQMKEREQSQSGKGELLTPPRRTT